MGETKPNSPPERGQACQACKKMPARRAASSISSKAGQRGKNAEGSQKPPPLGHVLLSASCCGQLLPGHGRPCGHPCLVFAMSTGMEAAVVTNPLIMLAQKWQKMLSRK